MWHATDITGPSTWAAHDPCMTNVKELQRHGVRVAGGLDAFDMIPACCRWGIRDLFSVGLVLWSGAHLAGMMGSRRSWRKSLERT